MLQNNILKNNLTNYIYYIAENTFERKKKSKVQFKSFLTNFYPFRLSKLLLILQSQACPNKVFFELLVCQKTWSPLFLGLFIFLTLCILMKEISSVYFFNFLCLRVQFVCLFCTLQDQNMEKQLYSSMVLLREFFTQLEESIYIPPDLLRFCIPNPQ